MRKDKLFGNELTGHVSVCGTGDVYGHGRGYGSTFGYGDSGGDGFGDGTGFRYGNLYRYFRNLKIYVPYDFPTRVLNYYNELVDNYE